MSDQVLLRTKFELSCIHQEVFWDKDHSLAMATRYILTPPPVQYGEQVGSESRILLVFPNQVATAHGGLSLAHLSEQLDIVITRHTPNYPVPEVEDGYTAMLARVEKKVRDGQLDPQILEHGPVLGYGRKEVGE